MDKEYTVTLTSKQIEVLYIICRGQTYETVADLMVTLKPCIDEHIKAVKDAQAAAINTVPNG